MKIHFLGAARTVTGSMHLLEINGSRLLLDCGLFQGRRAESFRRNRTLPFSAEEIDAVILSHAHIDHSGNLPHLIKAGYQGPIYTTPATAHLANIMLLDSGYIQEKDAEYINKKRAKQGKKPVEPLYTKEDAARVSPQFSGMHYQQAFQPIPGVQAHLEDAGHILGAAAFLNVEYDTSCSQDMPGVLQVSLHAWNGLEGLPVVHSRELGRHPGSIFFGV
ncbi:MAG: MBL fold metallo-hydrolase, partial [Anaerolineales bacterium]